MSRESKIFNARTKEQVGRKIKENEAFGWELLSINGLEIAMSRNTQIEVYAELVKHEYTYQELCEKRDSMIPPMRPKPFDFGIFVLLCILLIFPGVLYVITTIKKKQAYEQALQQFKITREDLEERIKSVCDISRSVFFSRR